jgi:GT2 family glycosyltransferase
MSAPTRVAVITACHNAERFIAATVKSVAAQTVSAEHVVVDDGSTDSSLSVLRGLNGRHPALTVVAQSHTGVASARATGYRAAGGGEYLLFLDADDVLHPSMLEVMTSYLDANPSVGLAYCLPQLIDESGVPLSEPQWSTRRYCQGRVLPRSVPDDEPITPLESVLTRIATIIPSVAVFRRSAYEMAGGWDEGLEQHCEDTDLFARVALVAEIHRVPRRLVGHRRHPGQATVRHEHMSRMEREFTQRWRQPLPHLSDVQRAAVRAAWRFHDRQLVPLQAIDAARRRIRSGRPISASRFVLGAVRITLASFRPPDRHGAPAAVHGVTPDRQPLDARQEPGAPRGAGAAVVEPGVATTTVSGEALR